ncbi:MAG: hypothetical protein QGI24_00070 [Kiritimatiellia bacterium]|nr:hypothetical protein [Kiritimatiellia bacterium]MDP6847153.1 hypothetical protein [Kiritimatiellia bacterium]
MADWRSDLSSVLNSTSTNPVQTRHEREASQMSGFVREVALPAFSELREELEKSGRDVTIRHSESTATIIVYSSGEEEITYRIQSRTFPNGILPYADIRFKERKGLKLIRAESMVRSGEPDYKLQDVTKDEVIENFLKHYLPRLKAE